jgi:hypothetical protein
MLTVTVSKKLAPLAVASYAEASRVVLAYIAKKNIGSGAWYRSLPFTPTSKGAAIHEDGVQVAFVSFNGRVWRGVEDFKPGHEEIPV